MPRDGAESTQIWPLLWAYAPMSGDTSPGTCCSAVSSRLTSTRTPLKIMSRLVLPLLLFVYLVTACGDGGSVSHGEGDSTAVRQPLDIDALAREGDLEGLVAALQPRFDANTISLVHARLLAEVRLMQNEIPKAVKILKQTIAEHPDSVESSLLLAGAYSSIGLREEALKVLLAARARGGSDQLLALDIALTHGGIGNLEDAKREFRRAREAGVKGADIDYNLALILTETGEIAGAREIFVRLLEAEPENPAIRRELARVMLLEGTSELGEIRALCNEVLGDSPEDWRAWELLADVELLAGDHLAAQTYYTSALEFGSKELGNNPPRVEEKYREAALGLREEFKDTGLFSTDDGSGQPGPRLPTGAQERRREARREAAEKGASSSGEGS
jgi:tetratricopeptide (TPR) repeat protein